MTFSSGDDADFGRDGVSGADGPGEGRDTAAVAADGGDRVSQDGAGMSGEAAGLSGEAPDGGLGAGGVTGGATDPAQAAEDGSGLSGDAPDEARDDVRAAGGAGPEAEAEAETEAATPEPDSLDKDDSGEPRPDKPNFLTSARFEDFSLPRKIIDGLDAAGFLYCTPIQAMVIPEALKGKDIAGQAQTGTGKTVAFLVPTMARLLARPAIKAGLPRALVVTPTRELAEQIYSDGKQLAAFTGLSLTLVIGGMDYREQARSLEEGPDIVVGTPGRLTDYIHKRVFNTDAVEVSVVDEADRLLELGFIRDLKFILSRLPSYETRQTMLFSATLSHQILELVYNFMNPPQYITAEPGPRSQDQIVQELYHVSRGEKLSLLLGLLKREEHSRVIIFCNTKSGVDWLAKKLVANGYHAEGITGDLPQPKRLRLMQSFKDNQLDIMVATDVASRGIHVEDVSHVFNYDIPQDAEDYVHRIGRTGRVGKTGKAVSFACEEYVHHLEAIENILGAKIPVIFADDELFLKDRSGVPLRGKSARGGSAGNGPDAARGQRAPAGEHSGGQGRGAQRQERGRPYRDSAPGAQGTSGTAGASPAPGTAPGDGSLPGSGQGAGLDGGAAGSAGSGHGGSSAGSAGSGYDGRPVASGSAGGPAGSGSAGGSAGSGYAGRPAASGYAGGPAGSGSAGGSAGSGYAGGSSGSGYAGGPAGSGYAGGSAGSGYAGGSAGSGYAGGSTGSGYAAGSGSAGGSAGSGSAGSSAGSGYAGSAAGSGSARGSAGSGYGRSAAGSAGSGGSAAGSAGSGSGAAGGSGGSGSGGGRGRGGPNGNARDPRDAAFAFRGLAFSSRPGGVFGLAPGQPVNASHPDVRFELSWKPSDIVTLPGEHPVHTVNGSSSRAAAEVSQTSSYDDLQDDILAAIEEAEPLSAVGAGASADGEPFGGLDPVAAGEDGIVQDAARTDEPADAASSTISATLAQAVADAPARAQDGLAQPPSPAGQYRPGQSQAQPGQYRPGQSQAQPQTHADLSRQGQPQPQAGQPQAQPGQSQAQPQARAGQTQSQAGQPQAGKAKAAEPGATVPNGAADGVQLADGEEQATTGRRRRRRHRSRHKSAQQAALAAEALADGLAEVHEDAEERAAEARALAGEARSPEQGAGAAATASSPAGPGAGAARASEPGTGKARPAEQGTGEVTPVAPPAAASGAQDASGWTPTDHKSFVVFDDPAKPRRQVTVADIAVSVPSGSGASGTSPAGDASGSQAAPDELEAQAEALADALADSLEGESRTGGTPPSGTPSSVPQAAGPRSGPEPSTGLAGAGVPAGTAPSAPFGPEVPAGEAVAQAAAEEAPAPAKRPRATRSKAAAAKEAKAAGGDQASGTEADAKAPKAESKPRAPRKAAEPKDPKDPKEPKAESKPRAPRKAAEPKEAKDAKATAPARGRTAKDSGTVKKD
ncbi:MAG: DEAD/DEAH box helicase [Deltaproteobacteria bacterium]|jgi:ATP-dependent RNA helicase RhlB|nr:DEAD/DEAH box helicase [Deltaproteobacteria bacterium]